MRMRFLTAEWQDLIIASYAIDPQILQSKLHPCLELDLFEGQAVCSLVGFRFADTKVLGIPWPGYRQFPEINLRFYVRECDGNRRGVVFIRELVKHRLVSMIARGMYNEPYVQAHITETHVVSGDTKSSVYQFEFNRGVGTLSVCAAAQPYLPSEDSPEHWFKEHQWGYGTTRSGRLIRYEVRHPIWECFPIESTNIDINWEKIYGPEWSVLTGAKPVSIAFAKGSSVEVFGAQKL